MKLLQLNAWSCSLSPEIIRLFERERPDIVCMQEVISVPKTRKILQSIQEITEAHPFAYEYYSPLVEFAYMDQRAQRGNIVLSQYPIVNQRTFWTHGSFQQDFDSTMNYNVARGVVHVTVDTPAGLVHVLTTHGYHLHAHKNGDDQTDDACQQIADYIAKLEGPIIVTGDFNLTPESHSMEILNACLHNLCVEHNIKTTRNRLTHKTETCDYILVNNDVNVSSFVVLDDIVSDHSALLLNM